MRYGKPVDVQRTQVRFVSNHGAGKETSATALHKTRACLWCRHEYVVSDGFGVFCSRTCALEEART